MSILGAYEESGLVVIEHSDHEPSCVTWRDALLRCNAVAQAEVGLPSGRREEGIQRAIEQIIAAARDARKKDPEQSNWTPPVSVSGFRPGNKNDIRMRKRAATIGLVTPGGIITP